MNRREIFSKTMLHQELDHVLVDMGKHIGSIHKFGYRKLKEYLNDTSLANEDLIIDRMAQTVVTDERLLERFNIDFRWLTPNFTAGAKDLDKNTFLDMWGVLFCDAGDYWAVGAPQLKNATLKDLENHKWPNPNHPDLFAGLDIKARELYEATDYVIGADGVKAGLLMTALQLRGYENFFMDMAANPGFAEALLDRILEVLKEMYTNYMRLVGPYVQLVYLTDDYGMQNSTLISPKMFRDLLKPRNKELIDHIKRLADVKIMFHSDGSILSLIDDFIEMGVDILNPVQTSVPELSDTFQLKEKYGDKICFHGGIDVQKILPHSTPEEIQREVHRRIYDLGRNGGYICAACHNIGHDIPSENIAAMYEAAHKYGKYPLKHY